MNELSTRDTIVAIATPPGRGGIGIVRLSGPDALTIATPMLRLRALLTPARARFCEILDPATGEKLDEAIATYFQKPNSYTGEDVLEIAAHGAPILLNFLLAEAISRGARLAEPGEFTERAFLAGRLDLTQAEAVRDLIDAQTLYQARIAASQLDGALSKRVQPIKQALIELIAHMEAGIDFAEDDTPVLGEEQFVTSTDRILEALSTLERSFNHGRLVHVGLTLAIVGQPNVGKSSLFNQLVERDRAIVTAQPGTTRDLVTERISLGGIPLELVDTAGMRLATDEAERQGIAKSQQALADADLVLIVLDASELTCLPIDAPDPTAAPCACTSDSQQVPYTDRPESLLNPWLVETAALIDQTQKRSILILNKCDLAGLLPEATDLQQKLTKKLHHQLPNTLGLPLAFTSAHTGAGLQELRYVIQTQIQAPHADEQTGMLTNLRQHTAVKSALDALANSVDSSRAQIPHEMLLLDLYNALTNLDKLTGTTTTDDILQLIFSTFCIGK